MRLSSVLLVSLAFVLRVAAFLDAPPLGTDEARYLITAHHFEMGMGYSDWRGPETHIHPLHPVLVSLLGSDPHSLELRGRIVALVCSLLMLWPLSALARRVAGVPGESTFLLLVGVHPWLVRAASSAQPESLYDLVTALAILLLWGSATAKVSSAGLAAAGGLFGLAYLARPEGLLVGALTGTVAGLAHSGRWTRRFGALGLFFSVLLAVSSPYLLFLKSSTGSWVLTGKTTELFFVGQAMYDASPGLPSVRDHLPLIERWGSIGTFVAANPWLVWLRILRNLRDIWGGSFALALGPAGIAGVALCARSFARDRARRLPMLLVACPCLTLVLMLLTYKNQRIVASTLPFAFLLAVWGLANQLDHPFLRSVRWRRLATFALFVCATAGWTPAMVRAASGRSERFMDKEAVGDAIHVAGSPARVASNNPALSFYAMDPTMYGPAGRYVPLPFETTCAEMTTELKRRGSTVAILDTSPGTPALPLDAPDCGLRVSSRWDGMSDGRVILVLALK